MTVSVVRYLVASSSKGCDYAVEQGLASATQTVRGITEMKVVNESAQVENGRIKAFCVKLRIRFDLDEA